MNDRSTNEVFGIGKYYDPSGYRMEAAEIAKHKRAAEIQERWDVRKAENQRKADELERAELRKKWAGVLVPLEDLNDWKEKEQQEKANIINYLHYHFPRAKFTARKGKGGHYYVISWQDGPSIEQVEKLSYIWHDHTFDMYQDYNEYTPTQFNRLFGGVEYSCDFNRRYSAGALETARGLFRSILPELSDLIGTGKAKELRRDDCDALNDWANMTVNCHRDNETARAIHEAGRNRVRNWHDVNPDYIINDYLDAQDLTPSEPSTDPEKPRKARKQTDPTNTKAEGSEAETEAREARLDANIFVSKEMATRVIKGGYVEYTCYSGDVIVCHVDDIKRGIAYLSGKDGIKLWHSASDLTATASHSLCLPEWLKEGTVITDGKNVSQRIKAITDNFVIFEWINGGLFDVNISTILQSFKPSVSGVCELIEAA